jgi:hypothetical protein
LSLHPSPVLVSLRSVSAAHQKSLQLNIFGVWSRFRTTLCNNVMRQLGHDMNEAREGRRKLCNTARTGVLRRAARAKQFEFFHSSRGNLGNAAIEQAANQRGNVWRR